MKVSVGPVRSSSALAWVAYAREIVDGLDRGSDDEPIPSDLIATFRAYLDEWTLASATDPFRWETDISSEVVEYHVHGFHRIVMRLAEEADRTGIPAGPSEGDQFYAALVSAIIEALSNEGPSAAEYAEQLRNFWPGLEATGEVSFDASA